MVLGLLACCDIIFGPAPLTIVGTVTLARSDQDVTSTFIRVRETGLVGRSESDGSFALPEIPAGDYTVEVSAPSYLRREVSARAPDGGEFDVSHNGLTPEQAVATLHRGMAGAYLANLSEIQIAEGTYDLNDTAVHISMQMRLVGGFDPDDWSASDPTNQETRIVGAFDILQVVATPGFVIRGVRILRRLTSCGGARPGRSAPPAPPSRPPPSAAMSEAAPIERRLDLLALRGSGNSPECPMLFFECMVSLPDYYLGGSMDTTQIATQK